MSLLFIPCSFIIFFFHKIGGKQKRRHGIRKNYQNCAYVKGHHSYILQFYRK